MECSHQKHVSLLSRHGECFLHHSGTGEVVHIAKPQDSTVQLEFPGAVGAAAILSIGNEKFSVTDLFSTMMCQTAVDGVNRFFFRRAGVSMWRDALLEKYTTVAVKFEISAPCDSVQVYIHNCGVGPEYARVWWSMSHVTSAVHKEQDYKKMFLKRRKLLDALLVDLGLPPECIRPNLASLQALKQQAGQQACVQVPEGPALQYWTGTTAASLALLLLWASKASAVVDNRQGRARQMMHEMLQQGLGPAGMERKKIKLML